MKHKHKFFSMKNWGFMVCIGVIVYAISQGALKGAYIIGGLNLAFWVLCHYNVKAKEYGPNGRGKKK